MRNVTLESEKRFHRGNRWAATEHAQRACSGPCAPCCNSAWIRLLVEIGPYWSHVVRFGSVFLSAAFFVPPPPDGAGCATGRSTLTSLFRRGRVHTVRELIRGRGEETCIHYFSFFFFVRTNIFFFFFFFLFKHGKFKFLYCEWIFISNIWSEKVRFWKKKFFKYLIWKFLLFLDDNFYYFFKWKLDLEEFWCKSYFEGYDINFWSFLYHCNFLPFNVILSKLKTEK